MCRVRIKGRVPPPDEIEKTFLTETLLKRGYRLACRVRQNKNIVVVIPETIGKARKSKNLGFALDIGTTVIKGAAVNLINGKILKTEKIYNPQQSMGGDVITRIGCVLDGKYKLLKNLLHSGIDRLQTALALEHPKFTTVVGNPVMLSFYLNKKVEGFARYPFQGEISRGVFTRNPARFIFGCIGGFIGGDTIAGIIASKILSNKKPGLYIDLGTNGEIALISDKKIYTVSTAAGPAFEGVGLTCGSLAQPGAIERVEYDDKFKIYTIDNKSPLGFCASGFIDLLATLLKLGWLDEYGKLKNKFQVADFHIEQMDIRILQLAIGAIHTGVKFLLDKTNLKPAKISEAVITGEFGAHLNSESLKQIGIIPQDIKKVRFENDLPLRGAISVLLNETNPGDAEKVRKMSVHFELAVQHDFQKRFVEGLFLKPWN